MVGAVIQTKIFTYIISPMNITLPDGSVRKLEPGANGLDLANDIGPGLAKAAIAVSVNGIQRDLCDPIDEDSEVSIITIDSDEGLEIMRHSKIVLLVLKIRWCRCSRHGGWALPLHGSVMPMLENLANAQGLAMMMPKTHVLS